MPTNFTTLPHFSVSSAMSLPKSAGVPGSIVPPSSASRAFILGSSRAALTSLLSLLTISAGVAFGAPRPYQIPPSYPGKNSPTVGMSGNSSERVAVVTASARSLPALMYSITEGMLVNTTCTCPPRRSVSAAAVPRCGTCHVHADHRLKQLALQMGGGSDTTRRHGELAGIGLGIGDELGDRRRWNREVRYHNVVHAGDAGNRRDVAAEIETELFVHRSIDRVCRGEQEERVAIRRARPRGGDFAPRPGPVSDDEGPPEPFRQPLAHQTCDDVESASCGGTDDQTHRPRRVGLSPSEARRGRQRGSAHCQMQKIS